MGAMDMFFSKMRLSQEEEFDEEEFYDDEEIEEEAKDPKAIRKFTRVDSEDKKNNKVTPLNRKRSNIAGMEVYGVKPKNIEDAREITQTLLENKTVVVNLEGLSVAEATRILDFAVGSAYALDASLQKISSAIYIIAPESVDISGAFQDILNN